MKEGKAMKTDKSKTEELPYFPRVKSYSVQEVIDAGGPEAFAEKLGKKPERIFERLSKLPPDSFLTEEEFKEAMATLNASK